MSEAKLIADGAIITRLFAAPDALQAVDVQLVLNEDGLRLTARSGDGGSMVKMVASPDTFDIFEGSGTFVADVTQAHKQAKAVAKVAGSSKAIALTLDDRIGFSYGRTRMSYPQTEETNFPNPPEFPFDVEFEADVKGILTALEPMHDTFNIAKAVNRAHLMFDADGESVLVRAASETERLVEAETEVAPCSATGFVKVSSDIIMGALKACKTGTVNIRYREAMPLTIVHDHMGIKSTYYVAPIVDTD